MNDKKLTVDFLRKNYKLQFILYCANIRNAAVNSADFEDKYYKFSDEVEYYKSKKYSCFRSGPLISKLDILPNPDMKNDKTK